MYNDVKNQKLIDKLNFDEQQRADDYTSCPVVGVVGALAIIGIVGVICGVLINGCL